MFTASLVAIGVPNASAATREVFCSRAGVNTLQAAIDGAGPGDTIRVHGVCVGNFSIPGAGSALSLTLQSIGGATLNGNGTGATLTIEGGATATVRDFKITGGRNTSTAGGIDVLSATLNLSRSTVYGNVGCNGGGIAVLGSSATILNSTVRDNLASCSDVGVGGGINVCGFILCGFEGVTTLTMIGSTVSGNTAAEGVGGGLDIVLAHAIVIASVVRDNNAAFGGGGIINQLNSDLDLSKSIVSGNVSTGAGGGLTNDCARASISGSLFQRNSSPGFDSESGVGGGIDNRSEATFTEGSMTLCGESSLSISTSTFTENTAVFGAAISNLATGGQRATISGTHLAIRGNVASTWGGAVFNQDEGGGVLLTLAQSVLSQNRAQYGGGIFNRANGGVATATLNPGTIVSNNNALADGGGIYNTEGGDIVLNGALVLRNTPNNCVGC